MKPVPVFEMDALQITLLMENGPGDMDVKAFIMQEPSHYHSIRVAYSVHGSEGDEIDSGIDGAERDMEPEAYEWAEGATPISLTIDYLTGVHAIEPSASFFHPGVWYEGAEATEPGTGITTRRSFHLKGFTPEEEKEVYDAIRRGR